MMEWNMYVYRHVLNAKLKDTMADWVPHPLYLI